MGNVISQGAAADAIIVDGRRTLANAIALGSPYKETAESFLKATTDLVAALDAKIATSTDAEVAVRAQVTAESAKCDDLVGRLRDEIWNEIGRPGNDPQFRQMFPTGVSGWTAVPVSKKPASLNLLAAIVENTTHPLISRERAAAVATAIRNAATALDGLNRLGDPVITETRVLKTQRTVAARALQVQMARLKKTWRGQGLSEADIHRIIPDRPQKGSFLASVEATEALPTTTPEPALAVVAEVPAAAK